MSFIMVGLTVLALMMKCSGLKRVSELRYRSTYLAMISVKTQVMFFTFQLMSPGRHLLPPAYEVQREVIFSVCVSVHWGEGGTPAHWSLISGSRYFAGGEGPPGHWSQALSKDRGMGDTPVKSQDRVSPQPGLGQEYPLPCQDQGR